MEALREVTGGQFHPHVYLLDGSTLIAYKKWGTEEPYYFKQGIKGFDKILSEVEASAPIRRNVTIEDVGNAAAFLLSDLASGITGEITYVDGGFSQVVGGMDFS